MNQAKPSYEGDGLYKLIESNDIGQKISFAYTTP